MIKIKELFISILIILVTIEIFAFVAVKFLHYTNIWYKYPTYTYWGPTIKESYDPLGPHYIDTESVSWATWHNANSEIRHKGDCYDVNMKFNEIGARGILPDSSDKKTTIFLGDSFIEGFALAENETIPAQYSNYKKVPVLNLGAGGSFGSTQMAMIYDSLGKKFKHNAIIACLYLENDFVDDDINQYYPSRYRPYLVEKTKKNDFEIVYKDSLKNSFAKNENYQKGQQIELIKKYSIADFFKKNDISFWQKITSLSFSSRLFMEIYYRAQSKDQLPMELKYSEKSLKILKYNLGKIAQNAISNGAEFYVVNIPSKYLLNALKTDIGYKAKIDSLIKAALAGTKAHYLDLTQHIVSKKMPLNDIFYDCDSHFNQKGAFITAEYLLYHTNF